MDSLLPTILSGAISAGMAFVGAFTAVRILVARLEERLNHQANRLDSHETRIQRLEAPYFVKD